MKVGIVVISFNHFLFTKFCIESIFKHTPRDLYKLCIVDNGSIDETKSWANNLLLNKDIDNFINNDYNMGACKASNQGMEIFMNDSDITHVLVMANDHIVTPNWLLPMINSDYACVNPFVFYSTSTMRKLDLNIGKIIDKYKYRRLKYLQSDSFENMCYVLNKTYENLDIFSEKFTQRYLENAVIPSTFIVWPGLILYKKEVIETIGFKDEEYLKFDLAAYADIDYYLRAYLAGFNSAVVMTSFVHHWGSITTRKNGLKQENEKGYTNKEGGAYKYFIKKWNCNPHNLTSLLTRKC